MRGFDCQCGEYLEARDDAALLEQMKQHADRAHRGEFDETRLRSMRDERAYDIRQDEGSQPLI